MGVQKQWRKLTNTMIENQMTDEEKAAKLYGLVYEVAQEKYKYELQRENIIANQAKNIQSVFSIISVALLTPLPFLTEKLDGLMPGKCLALMYIWVFTALTLSFVIACAIQFRSKKLFWGNIETVEETVSNNHEKLVDDAAQKRWFVDAYKDILKIYTPQNDNRMFFLNLALGFIILAVISVVIFSLVIIYHVTRG